MINGLEEISRWERKEEGEGGEGEGEEGTAEKSIKTIVKGGG